MSNEAMTKACGQFFDGLPEDKRDGMTKGQFMNEVKRLLDPDRNANILDNMVEMRHKHRVAREQKAIIDRAQRNKAIGLR